MLNERKTDKCVAHSFAIGKTSRPGRATAGVRCITVLNFSVAERGGHRVVLRCRTVPRVRLQRPRVWRIVCAMRADDIAQPRFLPEAAGPRTLRRLAVRARVTAFILGTAASAAFAATALPAIDPEASGKSVAARVCVNCHGADGNAPPGEVPNLAGQREEFLRRQLTAFKSHSRRDQAATETMWSVSHNLNNRQIDELAAHFAAQQPRRQPIEGEPDEISAGQRIFSGGAVEKNVPACSGCHGADGLGKGDAPRLAGQHVGYLAKQLGVFQTSNDRPGAPLMRSVAHELTPENIRNVAAYLQALPSIRTH